VPDESQLNSTISGWVLTAFGGSMLRKEKDMNQQMVMEDRGKALL